jgi:ATP-binding cassette subfamily B protein
MFKNILRLILHLEPIRRKQLLFVLCLMVLASFAEIFAIGSILPFIGALMAPEKIFEQQYAQPFIALMNIKDAKSLLLPITILFCFFGLLSGLIRALLLWAQTRLSYGVGSDLSIKLYACTLYKPYSAHVMQNSSAVIVGLSKVVSVVSGTVTPSLNILGSSLILMAVLLSLFLVDSKLVIFAALGFGFTYWAIFFFTKKLLVRDGRIMSVQQTIALKYLNESLGGIRDVIIDGVQPIFLDLYKKTEVSLRRAQGNIQIIGGIPRYLIEPLGIVFIATISFFIVSDDPISSSVVPTLALLALASQRTLPLFQQIYSGLTSIRGTQASLLDVLSLLDEKLPSRQFTNVSKDISFTESIELKNISFQYTVDRPSALHNINLIINKGDRIGIIGSTGCGKTTLLDIIMGLLLPSGGILSIDGVSIDQSNIRGWQDHLSHVPQAIFLSDATIAENIAFGVPMQEIDMERVRVAALRSCIAETIEGWPEAYKTVIGERGVRLSGGQRQRIGIARALYKNSTLLILDEATSALDDKSERSVMSEVNALDNQLTLIIVAHRLTTLMGCTKIVELERGTIKRIGSYEQIIGKYKEANNHV